MEQDITTITISQRNTLPVRPPPPPSWPRLPSLNRLLQEFHTQHLSLGEDSASGWSLGEIEAGQKNVVASAV